MNDRLLSFLCYNKKQNTPALELYKKLGFVEQAHIPDIIHYKNEYTPGVLMYRKVE